LAQEVLKIGQLARQTGLTVRTLHWYDQIGLLKPSRQTQSGHRLYFPSDISRLQQIKSLQDLGFALKEIKKMLSNSDFDPQEVLQKQLELLNGKIEQQIRLRYRLESLARHYRSSQGISVEELLKTIKEIVQMEKYYTPEQLEKIRQRRESLGEETIRSAEEEWKGLFEKYKEEMGKGTAPSAPSVQKLAKRSWALIAAFTGGDAGIEKSLAAMYRQHGGSNVIAQHGIQLDPRVWEYMSQAMRTSKQFGREE
jgi:DNA-binding transcriptional MerR regulator